MPATAEADETTIGTISTARGDVECATTGEGLPVLVVHGSPGGHDAGLAMARFLKPHGFRAIVSDRPATSTAR